MNERIKELFSIAFEYADKGHRDGDPSFGNKYRDKFAELIIQECVELFPLKTRMVVVQYKV